MAALLCHQLAAVKTDRVTRIAPDLWARECATCGDVLTGQDIGAVASANAKHVTRNHSRFNLADALAWYRTLPEAEIRRQQDMCAEQTRRAYGARNTRALADLQAMADALTAAMLERC